MIISIGKALENRVSERREANIFQISPTISVRIWSVRFNLFHDQLILSSGSDCKVLLTSAASVSSEAANENRLADGLLHCYDQHEDSVYCVEWSNVDPWVFASLSYDGRLCISKVPKDVKAKLSY